ncbi:AAA family ATPase [Rhizobium sp. BE258]|uniref:AAA family ATPase n=1 Tax=Rhizobium sp. BE258 TaxID=2817722 RepID=UPI00285E14A7|nr:AAA family ATPase [Rhizobium sp. BE258]MDR7147164.1 RecA-family ATPase [Rhizobium sp. BE258]
MAAAAAETQPKLKVGDRVSHVDYGSGSVTFAGNFMSRVEFDDGSTRSIIPDERWFRHATNAANDNHAAATSSRTEAREAEKPPAEEPLNFVDPTEWNGKPVPTRQWYAVDLIPLRQVTIVNGDGGVGKSLLTLQIAAAGAMGVDTLEMSPAAGHTLYVGAEDEAEEFWRRLIDIAEAHGKSLGDLSGFRLLPLADRDALLSLPDKSGKMMPTPLMEGIFDFAAEWQPRLIVFDTAADLFGGDEIKRGQVRQFIGMLRQVAIALDCAVVLLAHPSVQGMQSGTGSSGSTAWNNSVRSRLYLTRPDPKGADDQDQRVLKTMKANYGTTGGEIKIRWKDGAFVLDRGGAVSPAANMIKRNAEKAFIDILRTFVRTGQNLGASRGTNYAPSRMVEHPSAEGFTKKSLADAMQRLLEKGTIKLVWDGPASKKRQRLIVTEDDYSVRRSGEE